MNSKERFIELLNKVERPFNKQGLINKLENSDFFIAPASTKYNFSYEGGLVDHCLSVYDIFSKLKETLNLDISDESVIVLSLFHDFYKMNFYDSYVKNEKVYSEYGSKSDNLGRFDWVSKNAYKVKEPEDRFIYGTNGETCEYMVRYYLPLSTEESIAIINSSNTNPLVYDITHIYNKYALSYLLHISDELSMFSSAWKFNREE